MTSLNSASSLSGTDFANFSFVVPNSLKFTSTKQGIAARRVPVKIRAEQQTYSSNNNRLVKIIFPNKSLYDTRNGYLTFDVAIATTGGTYKRIHSGIFSVFNRLRMMAGAAEVEDLRDYNRIYSALWEMINPSDVTSNIGTELMGFGTQAQRNALGAATTSFACPIFSGCLNTELLPVENIQAGLTLELYLEDGTACVETDGTNPIITISNIIFHMEKLEVDEQYRNYIKNYVNTNGMVIGFHTWERLINSLTTGSRHDLNMNIKNSSINGILNFIINSANLNDTTVNDKFLNWTSSPGGTEELTESSCQINGTMFPEEPIDCSSVMKVEPFQMYCRWIMKWKLNGFLSIAPPINIEAFNDNRFVQIDDFEAYPEEMDLINPFTTLGNNGALIKKIRFSGAIPSGWQLDSWVEYFRQVRITPEGKVIILQ